MNKPLRLPLSFALAVLSAALLILLFPPFNLAWLAPFALTPILVALAREPRPLRRFLLGWTAGVVYWFTVCTWIQFVLEVHGGIGRWGGWGTFVLFCFAKALHFGVFSALAGVLLPRPYALPAVAALWTGIERTHGTLGFAWLTLGNAGVDMAVPMRAAPFVGVYGLSFTFALLSTAVALVILRRPRKQLWPALAVVVLLLLPALPAPVAGTQTAALVQPNVPEEFDWTEKAADHMRQRLLTQSLQAAQKTDLLVWPEVPGPLYYDRDPRFRAEAAGLARATNSFFLFGTVGNSATGAPLNSAVLLRPDGTYVDHYDKMYLVPFGEFIPPLFGFVNRITQEAGDFTPGERVVVFPAGAHRIGTFICYESAFPHLVRQFARQGAQVFVNISNDGYFGHSAAREQHLSIARMRAAENRRWILRATNDGITAAIDPAGRVLQRSPLYAEETLRAGYSYVDETTMYTRYGDWFAWGCLLAAALALAVSQKPHYRKPVRRPLE